MNKRNSSIELLRLVLMFFIVAHHGIVHGLGLAGFSGTMKDVCILREDDFFPACLINAFFIIAVNTFVLISGFYSIKHIKKKGYYLISQLIVCTFLFTVPYYFLKGDLVHGFSNIFIISHSRYWFIIDYFILMAFAPALNYFFEKVGNKEQLGFVLFMVFVTCYLGFIWNHASNDNGRSIIQFITLYSIGRFLSNNPIQISRKVSIVTYVVCSIIIAFSMSILHNKGIDALAWRMTQYNDPLVVVSSIALFYFFYSFHFQSDRINKISGSSLFIYLFSCSALIEKNYYSVVGAVYNNYSLNIFLFIIIFSLVISIVAVLVDKLLVSKLVFMLDKLIYNSILMQTKKKVK